MVGNWLEPTLIVFGMDELYNSRSYWMVLKEFMNNLLWKTLPFRGKVGAGAAIEGHARMSAGLERTVCLHL